MKKIFNLFLALLIITSLDLKIVSASSYQDTQAKLLKLKKELAEELSNNLLPFWTVNMVDDANGGFYGKISVDNVVDANSDKGGILNARILWTYSAAYRITKDTSYLRMANRAYEYIINHFIDKEYGGAYRSVNALGDPSDLRKQTYTQSFFIYGFSEYYRATGKQDALDMAISIFGAFEKYALDKESNGYFEVFTRDWQRSRDRLIGEKSDADEKTMNTHLHIMEAYANLYRVWPDKRMEERLRNLVDIFLKKIIDKETYHLINFMERNWKSTSTIDSYGHDIEASWLLYEAAHLLDDKALLVRVEEVSIKIANAAAEGIQPDGSLVYEKDFSTGHVNTNRSWWAQSETVVGYLNAYELTEDEKYLDRAISCWIYIKTHMIDYDGGGWFANVSAEGVVARGEKGGFWTCPYHNSRMCLEVIERISE